MPHQQTAWDTRFSANPRGERAPIYHIQGQHAPGRKLYLTDEQFRQLLTGQDAEEGISLPPHRWYHYALFVTLGFLTLFALCAMGRPGA